MQESLVDMLLNSCDTPYTVRDEPLFVRHAHLNPKP